MKKWIALVVLLLPLPVLASAFLPYPSNTVYGGIGHGTARSEISTWKDHDENLYLKAFIGWHITHWLALEAGGLWFDDLRIKEEDAVGRYTLEFKRYDVYLSPVVQLKPAYFVPIRLAAAVTMSSMDMTVKESFWGLSPSGSVSRKDDVQGLYLSAGIVPFQRSRVSGLISVDYIKRPDLFKQSNRAFDSEELGLSFRLSFH